MRRAPLPFVFLNFAMTADGKITTANRRVTSFSSPRDREHMYELRVNADAVMAGARTVDLNPVTLGPGGAKYRRRRIRGGLHEYNLRIIVSGSGTVDPKSKVFEKRIGKTILLTTRRASAARLRRLRPLVDEIHICGTREINFRSALVWLRSKWNVRRLLCEGGGELVGAFFRQRLVNELHLTICPKIFGGRDAPTICDGEGFDSLAAAAQLELKSRRRHGDELFLVYRVK